MFTGKYFDWNQKRLKGIIDHYGHHFFSNKKILDLGCGYADISGPLSRLGADIVAVDARKEHLDIASKRYPGIKTINADLDRNYPFIGQNFDIILDLGLLCHLIDYEKHLKNVCSSAKFLVLETAVSDHSDDRKSIAVKESKNVFDLSVNGLGSRPTTNAIERVLKECGMSFVRVNNNKFNSGSYKYDWVESNNSDSSLDKRRIWFCTKDSVENTILTTPVVIQSSGATINSELENNSLIQSSFSMLEASQQVKQASMSKFYPTKFSETKINFILNLFSSKFFYNKYILDAGAGDGEFGAAFLRLGAGVTAADARQEHLNNIRKKYPNIKTIRLNFESPLNINTKFDITLSIDTLCHVSNYEKHLRDLCNRSKIIFLETAVCDSSDPNISFSVSENSSNNNLSFSGLASSPSAAKIEKILAEQGMFYVRIDDPQLNYEKYVYDWVVLNSKNQDSSLRRFWICCKNSHIISEISSKLNSKNNSSNQKIDTLDVSQETSQTNIYNNTSSVPQKPLNTYVSYSANKIKDKKFVIVIPSYKNEKWAEKNILSALNQNYDKFRIIYTDDCSPDSTFDIVSKTVNSHVNKHKVSLIKNENRQGALKNLYNMIHSCDDNEIILTLDGDDWLSDANVLNILNHTYQDDNVWLTYGQYKGYPNNDLGLNQKIPSNVINKNSYREYSWVTSHLRTFYSWIFKKIKKEDLMHKEEFFSMAWDLAMMYPMLEMSGGKFKFVDKVLYIYNVSNPINDYKVNQQLQSTLESIIRKKNKYNKIEYSYDSHFFIKAE
jgi:2-polyprenyl-3-methyl-5-hydroxy-6-metoxy-1,4-benzoquinol methylase/glycosyltransferase involved in cell wall biosynthesis